MPKCPHCSRHLKIGPLKLFSTRSELAEDPQHTATEKRETFVCTCTKTQGLWWNSVGEVIAPKDWKGDTPLDLESI